jgi:DNA repair protein RadC
MKDYDSKLNIRSWAEEDRPREKLMLKGKRALSDAELMAILIGSGSHEETAVSLCKRILSDYDHDLNFLGKLTVSQLTQFKGIGEAKAISIVAALELGRRRQSSEIRKKKQIRSSQDVFKLMAPVMSDLQHEEFYALFLNRSNKVILTDQVSMGGVSGTVVDVKKLYFNAINLQVSNLIICHNHPSGSLRPSYADKQLTRKVSESAKLLDISLLDHVIIAENGFYSFADHGHM